MRTRHWVLIAMAMATACASATTRPPAAEPVRRDIGAAAAPEAELEALDAARVALRQSCDQPAPEPSADAARHLDQALAALDAQDMERFVSELEVAAELGAAQAHYNLGYFHGEQGNLVRAHRRLVEALTLDPCYHVARLELGRYFIDGMGVERDPLEGVLAMRRVVDEAPTDVADVARINLAMAFLYGLGVDPDFERTRALLREATPHPSAVSLLGQLPESDPWGDLPREPERPRVPPVLEREGDHWRVPPWARTGEAVPDSERPPSGSYTRAHSVAVGLPGEGHGEPGVERTRDCMEVDGRRVRFSTVHTNGDRCRWEGRLTRHLVDGSWLAIEAAPVPVLEASTGKPADFPHCAVRLRLEGNRGELLSDWPTGCAARSCGRRSYPMGRAFGSARGSSCDPPE